MQGLEIDTTSGFQYMVAWDNTITEKNYNKWCFRDT